MDSAKLPESIETTPEGQRPADVFDQKDKNLNSNKITNMIPDEVPRKDGPGGEGS